MVQKDLINQELIYREIVCINVNLEAKQIIKDKQIFEKLSRLVEAILL